MSECIRIITSANPAERNRSLDSFAQSASLETLLAECAALDRFRREEENLYARVRALFFLYALYRFHLPHRLAPGAGGLIPYDGYTNLLKRRFEEAIDIFLAAQATQGPGDGIASALGAAYHSLAFQTLADQVRRSVRSVRGNQWMFRIGHPADHPLRVRPQLCKPAAGGLYPILRESTPVRMDLTHSGWSDIFFLGMDFPEGARVLNISVDLCIQGGSAGDSLSGHRPNTPRPPIETFFRVIDRPVLRLASVDLEAAAEIHTLEEVFDFARDYLGLLKAALIAAGLIPPGVEGSAQPLSALLARLVGPGKGIELVSQVNGIPKGSRLAVSTNLLASLIAVCMRATGQTQNLTGALSEAERRIVAARAILGEWLGGSGGGWQDSGGVWPGIKVIQGVEAGADDPEFGVSRGRLLPNHRLLTSTDVDDATRARLQASLVAVHGGMAQDVGPILEMVTEKYLLRAEAEWAARQEAIRIIDDVLAQLHAGDIRALGAATHRNFHGPIQTIIPWATNLYTERIIHQVQAEFGPQFWGFWMMGGMSGGGMGFMFDPAVKQQAQARLLTIMRETKRALENAVPFAMDPVVYDFAINERGTFAELYTGEDALMPPGYYVQTIPLVLRQEPHTLAASRRVELAAFSASTRRAATPGGTMQALFDRLLPSVDTREDAGPDLNQLLTQLGFDRVQHEQIRANLRSGRIGLAQNRLPVSSQIEDVRPGDVVDLSRDWGEPGAYAAAREAGRQAMQEGRVAVVSLAGGAGSRWTHGAGVVKALNPFARLGGAHRSFVEVHLAKSRRAGEQIGADIPHIFTTSYLTHAPIADYLAAHENYGYPGLLILSPGRSVGLRMVPMARDLRFAWEEMPQQLLDEQAQKVQDSLHTALIGWARAVGEGSDYTDNLPQQCLHPVGHWYEVPNLLRNGVLADLLTQRPQLQYLMVHNIDTLGVNVHSLPLGLHILAEAAWSSEVIPRRLEDRGGGLARINGRPQLIEGLALPREEMEFGLSYYNTGTSWLQIDKLLAHFGLTRADLYDEARVADAVRVQAARMPTYITLKDVKKRWGQGQEDIFPVTQFEKLWGDMTGLPDLDCRYLVVPRLRGQQLKEVAQLDGWLRDGSAAYVGQLCAWG